MTEGFFVTLNSLFVLCTCNKSKHNTVPEKGGQGEASSLQTWALTYI